MPSPAYSINNLHEANRNILSHKQNKVGATLISGYEYIVNSLGQRTSVSQNGSAFSAPQGIEWQYDPFGRTVVITGLVKGG